MNIFEVLSQGKGRLNEENLSAMLGFLLSPYQAHGLSDIFLNHFLNLVANSCEENTRFANALSEHTPTRADVLLESIYNLGKKRRVIDIEIRIYKTSIKKTTNKNYVELHRVVIENKIKAEAASLNQLKEEFDFVYTDINNDETDITMVFLTPKSEHPKLSEEYKMLDKKILNRHKKCWLHWFDDEDSDNTVAKLIKEILRKENSAEIPPMTEYLRHTLKAFVQHLAEISKEKGTGPKDPATWGIEQVVFVKIPAGNYRIEKFKNSTVRVVNLETKKYEPAKTLLGKIIREKGLAINLKESDGTVKNSRILGEEVMDELIRHGKDMKNM